MRQIYQIEFEGRAGDTTDVRVQKLIEQYGGEVIDAGTFMIGEPVRDIGFTVPADKAEKLLTILRLAGFKPMARVQ